MPTNKKLKQNITASKVSNSSNDIFKNLSTTILLLNDTIGDMRQFQEDFFSKMNEDTKKINKKEEKTFKQTFGDSGTSYIGKNNKKFVDNLNKTFDNNITKFTEKVTNALLDNNRFNTEYVSTLDDSINKKFENYFDTIEDKKYTNEGDSRFFRLADKLFDKVRDSIAGFGPIGAQISKVIPDLDTASINRQEKSLFKDIVKQLKTTSKPENIDKIMSSVSALFIRNNQESKLPEFLNALKYYNKDLNAKVSSSLERLAKDNFEEGDEIAANVEKFRIKTGEIINILSTNLPNLQKKLVDLSKDNDYNNVEFWNSINEKINDKLKNISEKDLDIKSQKNIKKILNEKIKGIATENDAILTKGTSVVGKVKNVFGGIGRFFKDLGKSLYKMGNLIFMAVVSVFAQVTYKYLNGILTKFKEVEEATKNFINNTGLLFSQYSKIYQEIGTINTQTMLYGGTTEDVYNAVTALKTEYGTLVAYNKELVIEMVNAKNILGISIESSAKLVKKLDELGIASNYFKTTTFKSIVNLSKLNNVAPNDAIKKLTEDYGDFYTLVSRTPEKISKIAVYAAKMNVSLSSMSAVGKTLLNLEESIENTMQANVLAGRNMNFNLARSLYINGDINDAYEEVLKQVGSLAEFNKLNMWAQEAIAKSVGLETSALREQLTISEKLKNMTQEEKDILSSQDSIKTVYQRLKDIFSGIGQSIFNPIITYMGKVAEKIKPHLEEGSKFMIAVKDAAEYLRNGFTNVIEKIFPLDNIDSFMNETLPTILTRIKEIATVIGGIVTLTFQLTSLVTNVVSIFYNASMSILNAIRTLWNVLTLDFKEASDSFNNGGNNFKNVFKSLVNIKEISDDWDEAIWGVSDKDLLLKNGITKKVPEYANGTDNAKGGLALVGERGVELLELPASARVHTTEKLEKLINKNLELNKQNNNNNISTQKIELLLTNLINVISNKDSNVYMDGNKLNSALTLKLGDSLIG